MKKLMSCTALIATIILLASCGGDQAEDATPDTQALLTSGTWKMNGVTVDGVNKNDLFTNFTLSFSSTGFTSKNGEPVWPATGTWSFASTDQKSFTRNDGVEVIVNDISETELTLKLTWTKNTLGGGRQASTSGNHTFVFIK